MSRVKQLISLFLFLVALFSYQSIFAQTTTAAVNGTVVDQNGNALPGANIIAVHEPSGTQYGTTSRLDGKYNLVNLRVGGPYKVTVSFVGYSTQVEQGFNLELGQNLKINFTLPEQAVQLTGVTITAEKGGILSQARTGAAQNVSLKQIEEIPTISRSFQSFAKLSPLFAGDGSLSAAGRTSRYNNIQLDGAQYNDMFGLGSTGTPGGQTYTNPVSLDAVREFQVVVAPYDVRLSGFTGGGINAITRAGTNNLSGSAYFYGRNQSLVGKNPNTGKSDFPDFKNYQYGVRLGGPIMKDKLFFFANAEMTINDRPLDNAAFQTGYGGQTPDQLKALADQFSNILSARGMNAGTYNQVVTQQPSTKFFLRFDYNISENHQLTLRHSFNSSYIDNLNGRGGSNGMAFDSYNYRIKNTTNSSVLQLTSHFGNNMSNELILGYTPIRDRRAGTAAPTPEIEVRELNRTFRMTAGPDRYSSANQLDQDVFEFTDNFSYYTGNHTITVGTHNEFFSFRNLFVRSFFGYYQYNSLADLQADKPAYYQHVYGIKGGEPSAKFSVAQFGFYVQDEWTVLPQLKLTFGFRVDIPTFPTKPEANDSLPKYFPNLRTDQIPSGNILYSPRIGFNWDVAGDRSTQIRGGVGIFTGKVPYVWMSNNYGNTGTLIAEVNNVFGKVLPLVVDPNSQYIAGDPRVTNGALGAPKTRSEIDIADPNLKMPQVLRFNFAVDQQLPEGIIGTAEIVYGRTINDMLYRLDNLNKPTGYIPQLGSGKDGRPIYGYYNSGNNNFFNIMDLYNTSDGYQYNLVLQLQRNVARGLSFNAGYSYGQAKDRNSVNSSQAQSQMRYNPIDNDANNPALTTSQYEIRNRLFASVSYTAEFFKNAPTTISLFYNGQTGSPFSFIVYGDLNNDSFDQNDLFYIPRNSSEILLGTIKSGQFVPATQTGRTWADLDAFMQNSDYLSANRGRIAERNAANAPWQEYFDLHISQDIPDLWGMGHFQVTLDIQNLLNLLNKDWGRIESAGYGTYTIVSYQGRITYNGKPNTPVYSFSKPANNTPFNYNNLASRWQMQLGVRYAF